MVSGVYMIEIGSGRYVGASKNIRLRWAQHRHYLKNHRHTERIQKAFDCFGEKHLKYTILEECTANRLNAREKFWIDHFFTDVTGLNTYRIENPPKGWRKGHKKSPEHLAKIADSVRVRSADPVYRQHMREKTRKHTPKMFSEMFRLKGLGVSQVEIARRLNISTASVSLTLRGLRNSDLER